MTNKIGPSDVCSMRIQMIPLQLSHKSKEIIALLKLLVDCQVPKISHAYSEELNSLTGGEEPSKPVWKHLLTNC